MRSFLLALLLTTACATAAPPPTLRPLDARHAADFRRAFDDARDHQRFIVALSPT